MRIIEPSIEIMRTGMEVEVSAGHATPEKFIEAVGRTCYKSEDKITDTSAAKFVSNLVKRGHEAVIEHWSLIFQTDARTYEAIVFDWETLMHDGNVKTNNRLRPFLRFTVTMFEDGEIRCLVSGNMRAWRDFLKAYVAEYDQIPRYLHTLVRDYPIFFPEYQDHLPLAIVNDIFKPVSVRDLTSSERRIHQDITVKFICDRGVSHEIVRHRVGSFAQESTRYCNYSQDKFDNGITVIRPSWCSKYSDIFKRWYEGCLMSEGAYFTLLSEGATPQEARSVLPNSLKTEVIVTMNIDGWDHFFDLRCDPAAHPDIREVACMGRDALIMEGVWNFATPVAE